MWQEGARKWTANNILLGGSTPVWPRPPALGPSAAAPQPGPGPPEARPATSEPPPSARPPRPPLS